MNESRHSEEELIRLSQQGDETAFRFLVEKYKSALFGTAYLILQNYQVTEEAVQETILKMWGHLPSLRDNNKLKPWLIRIVVNEARQLLRKKRV
ncbi:RNA polymerase sigma factor, partial [Chloroflexota bacterium]